MSDFIVQKSIRFYASGERREEEVLSEFFQCFQRSVHSRRGWSEHDSIRYVEFEEYYEGISLAIESHTDFEHLMSNVWGV